MNRLFGSSKAKPKATLNDAIAGTDSRIDAVEVKLRKLDAELTRYRDQMKRMRDGPGKNAVKQKALRVLQQKKQYESQRDLLQQQTFNMEQAGFVTENLKNTMTTVQAMQDANKVLKKQYKKMDIDKIETIQDDMEDLMEQANMVQESLGRAYGVPDEIDEADLDAELEALGDDFGYEETETPSYLAEDEVPDYVDELPAAEEVPAEEAAPIKAS